MHGGFLILYSVNLRSTPCNSVSLILVTPKLNEPSMTGNLAFLAISVLPLGIMNFRFPSLSRIGNLSTLPLMLPLLMLLSLTACQTALNPPVSPSGLTNPPPFNLPAGFAARELVTGLQQPTQFTIGSDGRLYIAQLNGAENAAAGQIIAVDPADGAQELLLSGLDKPTGLALLEDMLWILTRDQLLRVSSLRQNVTGSVDLILDALPNNGRSNGTLTVTPAGKLLFNTSGRLQGNEAAARSAVLWQVDPAYPFTPVPLATGLKNAYAHAFDADGRLWSTEIGDGAVVGTNYDDQPPEELNEIFAGADYGWPRCFADQQPALNRDGTAERCAQTRLPWVTFPPRATPTSVAPSPFAADTLLVALWVSGEVTSVSTIDGRVSPFVTNADTPQHLLPTPTGTLLLSDYQNGVIYEIYEVEN
jgi:glucose/arabinose dehydrogenase